MIPRDTTPFCTLSSVFQTKIQGTCKYETLFMQFLLDALSSLQLKGNRHDALTTSFQNTPERALKPYESQEKADSSTK